MRPPPQSPPASRRPPPSRHPRAWERRQRTARPPEMEEDLLQVAAPGPELARPRLQLFVARAAPPHQLERGAADPAIYGVGVEAIQAEEEHAVRDLRADAGEFL